MTTAEKMLIQLLGIQQLLAITHAKLNACRKTVSDLMTMYGENAMKMGAILIHPGNDDPNQEVRDTWKEIMDKSHQVLILEGRMGLLHDKEKVTKKWLDANNKELWSLYWTDDNLEEVDMDTMQQHGKGRNI
jgi:hypothetical protein